MDEEFYNAIGTNLLKMPWNPKWALLNVFYNQIARACKNRTKVEAQEVTQELVHETRHTHHYFVEVEGCSKMTNEL